MLTIHRKMHARLEFHLGKWFSVEIQASVLQFVLGVRIDGQRAEMSGRDLAGHAPGVSESGGSFPQEETESIFENRNALS